jgi:hypothetical protein
VREEKIVKITSRSIVLYLAILVQLAACSGGGGGGGIGGGTSTYSISGTVSGAVLQGVNIALSGSASATTTTDDSGNYSFTGVPNGSYTVTPSKAGYTSNPPTLV